MRPDIVQKPSHGDEGGNGCDDTCESDQGDRFVWGRMTESVQGFFGAGRHQGGDTEEEREFSGSSAG